MTRGRLCLVLHAHLPFVRHPEHPTFLEEDWLFEAVHECYAPLITSWLRLAEEGVPFRLTLSVSPTLAAMLGDELLRRRYAARLTRLEDLAAREVRRTAGGPFAAAAWSMQELLAGTRRLWEAWGGDLLRPLVELAAAGRLELIPATATHAYLPLVATTAGRRAQLRVAAESHRRTFGRPPRGIWLAECGYDEGLDRLLAAEGLSFFFLEAHGLLWGSPPPRAGVFAPAATPAGCAAFARDPECGRRVWSAREGYPGDPLYREYYRDLGFDADYETIRPFLHPDGVRRHLGFKYHRITGPEVPLHAKEPYDPAAAAARALAHARDFVATLAARAAALEEVLGRPPVFAAPYDAELFGHWWFEGPRFLEGVLREAARHPALRLATPPEILSEGGELEVLEPNPSSWGAEGFAAVWLNGRTGWMYRHLHRAERRMAALAQAHPAAAGLRRRALDQAARELLLAEASDWPFIVSQGTAVPYALARFRRHVEAFLELDAMLSGAAPLRAERVEALEGQDPIFPWLDYRVYALTGA